MIINSIEMDYFFRIYSSKKLEFSIDGDKNVTVIKGDNGTGKTTMLSAFSWVFYGVVDEPLVVDNMLNKRKRYEMKTGEIETSGVKVSISDCGHTYIISRYQKFKKIGDNETVKIGEPDFSVIDTSNPANYISDKNFFESIIPSDLKGFFFFDGERIDRLAKIDGHVEIRKAILDILGLTTLEKIENAVGEVQSEYNKKVKTASKSETVKTLSQEYDDTEEAIKADRDKLDQIQNKKKGAKSQIDTCEMFLKEHNAEAVKALQIQRDSLESEKKNIKDELERRNKEVMRHISKNLKYYLLSERFDEISEFLEDKRKKKELPSDIKIQFVHDLLCSGECICGQTLKEGEKYYLNIAKLLETAGREELDNAYITMRAFVDSNEVREVVNSFYVKINEYSNYVIDASTQIENIDKQLKVIGGKLASDFGDLIAEYENQLELAKKTHEDCAGEEFYLKKLIESNDAKKKAIESKLRIEQGKQDTKNMFGDAFNIAVEVRKLNDEIRNLFIEITREDMDEKIKKVFSSISRKEDREACLDDNFDLTIQNKTTHTSQILSTGERQITSLAFIGALVSYAKEKVESELITDFCGGDFPIVMDSPFGNLGATHKANVAKGLPELASQVIVIVSDEQWNGTVEENIAERVHTIYSMEDGKYEGVDDEFTVFKGGKV